MASTGGVTSPPPGGNSSGEGGVTGAGSSMTTELPPGLQKFFKVTLGMTWPEGSEGGLKEMSRAWSAFQKELAERADEYDRLVPRLEQAMRGDTARALVDGLKQASEGFRSDADTAAEFAKVCKNTAADIQKGKIMLIAMAALVLAMMIQLLCSLFGAFGIPALLAAARAGLSAILKMIVAKVAEHGLVRGLTLAARELLSKFVHRVAQIGAGKGAGGGAGKSITEGAGKGAAEGAGKAAGPSPSKFGEDAAAYFRNSWSKIAAANAEKGAAGVAKTVGQSILSHGGRIGWTMAKYAAGGALFMGGLDGGIQLFQMGFDGKDGVSGRDEFDWNSLKNSVIGGAIGGAAFGMFHGVVKPFANMVKGLGTPPPGWLTGVGNLGYAASQVSMVTASNPLVNKATGHNEEIWSGILGGAGKFNYSSATSAKLDNAVGNIGQKLGGLVGMHFGPKDQAGGLGDKAPLLGDRGEGATQDSPGSGHESPADNEHGWDSPDEDESAPVVIPDGPVESTGGFTNQGQQIGSLGNLFGDGGQSITTMSDGQANGLGGHAENGNQPAGTVGGNGNQPAGTVGGNGNQPAGTVGGNGSQQGVPGGPGTQGGQQAPPPGGQQQDVTGGKGGNGTPVRTESGGLPGKQPVTTGGSPAAQPATQQSGPQPATRPSTQPSTTGGPRQGAPVTQPTPSHVDSSGHAPAPAASTPRGPDTPPPDGGSSRAPNVDTPAPPRGRPNLSIDTSFTRGDQPSSPVSPISPSTGNHLNGTPSSPVSPISPATPTPSTAGPVGSGQTTGHPSGPQNPAPRVDPSSAGAQPAPVRSDGPAPGQIDKSTQDRLSSVLNKPVDRLFTDRMMDRPATQSPDHAAPPDRRVAPDRPGPSDRPAPQPDRGVAHTGERPAAPASDRPAAKSPKPEDVAAAAVAVAHLRPDHHGSDHRGTGAPQVNHADPDGPGPDFAHRDAKWQERRDATPPTRISSERFRPLSPKGGLSVENGQVSGRITQIRFDTRHFEAGPGKWVLEFTVPLDLVSPDGAVDARTRRAMADELQQHLDERFNFRHTWPGKGQFEGSQVHFTVEVETPNGITRGWDADPSRNVPVEVRDSSTGDPFRRAVVPGVNQLQWDLGKSVNSRAHEYFHFLGLDEGHTDPNMLFDPTLGRDGIMGDHLDMRLTPEQLGLIGKALDGFSNPSRPVVSHSLADPNTYTRPAPNPADPGDLVHSIYAEGPYSAQHAPTNAPHDPDPGRPGPAGQPAAHDVAETSATSPKSLVEALNDYIEYIEAGKSRVGEQATTHEVELRGREAALNDAVGRVSQRELNQHVEQFAGDGDIERARILQDQSLRLDERARRDPSGRPDHLIWTGREIRDQAGDVRKLAGELEGLAKSGGRTPEELRRLADDLKRSADRLDTALQGFVKDAARFGGTYTMRNEHAPVAAVAQHLAKLVDEAARAAEPGTRVPLDLKNFLGTETSVARVRRGLPSFVRRYRTNQAFAEVPTGEQWKTVLPGKDGQWNAVFENVAQMSKAERIQFVRTLSEKNIETLREDVDELLNGMSHEERQKFEDLRGRLVDLPYRIKHATPAYHAIANSGVILSQGDLARRDAKFLTSGKSSVKNTSNLGNNDFVFFRMEVGDEPMASRYGPTTLIFDAKVLEEKDGWASLHDQLHPLGRETMRELKFEGKVVRTAKYDTGFDAPGKRVRWTYQYPGNNSARKVSFEHEVFHGEHVREALALSVVREVARIGGDFKNHVLNLDNPEALGSVISKLYRPEAKFGSGLPINPVGSSVRTEWPTPVGVVNENGDGRYLPDGTVDLVARAAGRYFDWAEDGWRQANEQKNRKNVAHFLQNARPRAEKSVALTKEFYATADGERKDLAKRLLDERSKLLSDINEWLVNPEPRSRPAETATPGAGTSTAGAGTAAPQLADLAKELPRHVESALSKALPDATEAMKKLARVLANSDGFRPLLDVKGGQTKAAVGLGRNAFDAAFKRLRGAGLTEMGDGGLRLTPKGRDLLLPPQPTTEPQATPASTAAVGNVNPPHRERPVAQTRFDPATNPPDLTTDGGPRQPGRWRGAGTETLRSGAVPPVVNPGWSGFTVPPATRQPSSQPSRSAVGRPFAGPVVPVLVMDGGQADGGARQPRLRRVPGTETLRPGAVPSVDPATGRTSHGTPASRADATAAAADQDGQRPRGRVDESRGESDWSESDVGGKPPERPVDGSDAGAPTRISAASFADETQARAFLRDNGFGLVSQVNQAKFDAGVSGHRTNCFAAAVQTITTLRTGMVHKSGPSAPVSVRDAEKSLGARFRKVPSFDEIDRIMSIQADPDAAGLVFVSRGGEDFGHYLTVHKGPAGLPVYIDGQSGRLADLGGNPTKIGLLVVNKGTPLEPVYADLDSSRPEGSSATLAAGPVHSKLGALGEVLTSRQLSETQWKSLRSWGASAVVAGSGRGRIESFVDAVKRGLDPATSQATIAALDKKSRLAISRETIATDANIGVNVLKKDGRWKRYGAATGQSVNVVEIQDDVSREYGAIHAPYGTQALAGDLNTRGVVVSVGQGASFGHQAAATALVTSLRELGVTGRITFVGDSLSMGKLQSLVSDELGPVELVDIETDTWRGAGDRVVFCAASDTLTAGDAAEAKQLLTNVGANEAFVLKPYGWETGRRLHIFRSGPDADPVIIDLDDQNAKYSMPEYSLYNFDVPRVDDPAKLKELIGSGMTDTERARGLRAVVDSVTGSGVNLMPVYGMLKLEGFLRPSASAHLAEAIHQQNSRASIMLEFTDSQVSYVPRHEAPWLRYADLADANLREVLGSLQRGDVLVLRTGTLPQDVFQQMFQLGDLPAVVEGANSTNLAQLIGRPYLSLYAESTAYPRHDSGGELADRLNGVTEAITSGTEWITQVTEAENPRREADFLVDDDSPVLRASALGGLLESLSTMRNQIAKNPDDGLWTVGDLGEKLHRALKGHGTKVATWLGGGAVANDVRRVVDDLDQIWQLGDRAINAEVRLTPEVIDRISTYATSELDSVGNKLKGREGNPPVAPNAPRPENVAVVAAALRELADQDSALGRYFDTVFREAQHPRNNQVAQILHYRNTEAAGVRDGALSGQDGVEGVGAGPRDAGFWSETNDRWTTDDGAGTYHGAFVIAPSPGSIATS